MVDAKPIIEGYRCTKCGKTYQREEDAQKCCQKKKIDWEGVDTFELKQVHLDLLKEANIGWDNCEFGAPCIDPKRPYGNSNVFDDIASAIKLKKKGNFDYKEEDWKEEAMDFMDDLHRQTQIALEIILHCQSFKLGIYKKKDRYSDEWGFFRGPPGSQSNSQESEGIKGYDEELAALK